MYKRVDPKEGTPVQFVGVYITHWQPEWCEPTACFIEAEYTLEDALDKLIDVQLIDNTPLAAQYARDEIEEILRKLAGECDG